MFKIDQLDALVNSYAVASLTSGNRVFHNQGAAPAGRFRFDRRSRTREKLTQEMAAEHLDITPRHYQELEVATVAPSFGVLIRCKKAFRSSWENLLDGV